MGKYDNAVGVLPDLEMIGGDTTAWKISLNHLAGDAYAYNELSTYSGVLTITPFSIAQGVRTTPVVTKTASVQRGLSQEATLTFEFEASDTMNLAGKYIYQIELGDEDYGRVGQGTLLIRRNNNPNRGGWS